MRKRKSWARIAPVVDETESEKAAALADTIVFAVGAEHADKLGECQRAFFFPLSGLCVYAVCWWVVSPSAAREEALIRACCLASRMVC